MFLPVSFIFSKGLQAKQSNLFQFRQGNLADLKLKNGFFKDISGPRLGQGLLNRWTSQLDLGCTTGGLERVVSVHNST